MQDMLIQRYLGNKSPIAQDIVEVVKGLAKPGDLIFDAFSGSLAVSSALRKAGFKVACNDINHFSWLFAQAYFTSSELPWPNNKLGNLGEDKHAAWAKIISELTSPYTKAMPPKERHTDIFDHYCEKGKKSAFTSKRGSSGRRRFFSPENAILIDRSLSRIRYWYRKERIDEKTRCILTASLLSAVEKVSNTQGTYHDFPREFIDERALKPIRIKLPSDESFFGIMSDHIGRAEDSLDFVKKVPRHRVLYLDPPYNFRQYTSYYFMLNLISSYAEIEDLGDFFSKVEFVRGQNMEVDFKSSFCNKKSFIPSLESLIRKADADYVVLSYFDGRNHWGEFKSESAETVGQKLLEEFFRSGLFVKNSFEWIPVQRLNYQSYGGHTAKFIKEFLFIAQKSKPIEVSNNLKRTAWTGQVLA